MLQDGGFKVVQMKAKAPVQTLALYDAAGQGREAADDQLAAGVERGADGGGIAEAGWGRTRTDRLSSRYLRCFGSTLAGRPAFPPIF